MDASAFPRFQEPLIVKDHSRCWPYYGENLHRHYLFVFL
jgi:hypothetical protein